jgi:4-hydroxy-3-methylbut-2-enyl diphosphate reductase IspH
LNFEYIKDFLVEIKKIYKNATLPLVSDICKATYERQSVIKNNFDKFDTLIVI